MNTQPKPIFVQPEAGKNLHFPGGDMASIMLSGEETGRTLAVVACTQAPDSGPPLHIHRNEDELFLLVEGHYSFLLLDSPRSSFDPGERCWCAEFHRPLVTNTAWIPEQQQQELIRLRLPRLRQGDRWCVVRKVGLRLARPAPLPPVDAGFHQLQGALGVIDLAGCGHIRSTSAEDLSSVE